MGDELRGFPGKNEVVIGLLPPARDRVKRRRSIEDTVELSGVELARVVSKLSRDW